MDRGELLIEDLKTGVQAFRAAFTALVYAMSADGTTRGKCSLWSRGQASVASTSATGGPSCPSEWPIQRSRRGARLTGLSVDDQRFRPEPAPPLAGTQIATGVLAPEYSLALLKSRRRSPEWLQVPWPYREVLESSPGMRPQHRDSPPRRVPRQSFH